MSLCYPISLFSTLAKVNDVNGKDSWHQVIIILIFWLPPTPNKDVSNICCDLNVLIIPNIEAKVAKVNNVNGKDSWTPMA